MNRTAKFIWLGIIVFLIYQINQCSREQDAYDARPEVVAQRAQEQAERDAKELADLNQTRMLDATAAMTDNPTPQNIANWEASKKAVYGEHWEGDWQTEVAANRGFWVDSYAQAQAEELQRELRERPVIVVVQPGT